MNAPNKKRNIQQELEISDAAFRDSKLLFENGSLEGAVSRGYYAAFHAVQAILLLLGLEPKTHQGAAYLFKHHFVETGFIDPKYSQILAKAQKYREETDYRHTMVFTKDDTEKTLMDIQDFINCLKGYIRSKGFSE